MSKVPVFTHGQGILVTTHGPGKLHLYSYGSNGRIPGCVGTTQTTRSGVSHFVISHSYTFTKYAFFWDGHGKAEYRIGPHLEKHPVGRSWKNASWCHWGNSYVEPLEVGPAYFHGSVNRDNQVTCFLLPEYLHE